MAACPRLMKSDYHIGGGLLRPPDPSNSFDRRDALSRKPETIGEQPRQRLYQRTLDEGMDDTGDRDEKHRSQQKQDQPGIGGVAVRHADPVEKDHADIKVDQVQRITDQTDIGQRRSEEHTSELQSLAY